MAIVTIPADFDGAKFTDKFDLDIHDFHIDGDQLSCPSLPNLTEADLLDCVVDLERLARITERRTSAKAIAKSVPGWAVWSPAQFNAWCDANLMTDVQIDALTLNANLKTNLKANNAFTRNAGLMLITFRDDKWSDLPEE